jgi:hypothetical protein
MKNGTTSVIERPQDFPPAHLVAQYFERMVSAAVITPQVHDLVPNSQTALSPPNACVNTACCGVRACAALPGPGLARGAAFFLACVVCECVRCVCMCALLSYVCVCIACVCLPAFTEPSLCGCVRGVPVCTMAEHPGGGPAVAAGPSRRAGGPRVPRQREGDAALSAAVAGGAMASCRHAPMCVGVSFCKCLRVSTRLVAPCLVSGTNPWRSVLVLL